MSAHPQPGTTPSQRRALTRRPILLATCLAVVLTMVTACAPRSDVTIEDYETESEQIGERLLATIQDVGRYQDDIIASQNIFVNAEGDDLEDHPWQYWQWEGGIELAADAEITPKQAADRMAEVLESEGWTADEPTLHETTGKYEYRRSGGQSDDGWYVELGFWTEKPPAPQNLSVIVVSPSTDRTAADS